MLLISLMDLENELFDLLQETYIGNPPIEARFPIEVWNMHER